MRLNTPEFRLPDLQQRAWAALGATTRIRRAMRRTVVPVQLLICTEDRPEPATLASELLAYSAECAIRYGLRRRLSLRRECSVSLDDRAGT
jgi:hypothetical protein